MAASILLNVFLVLLSFTVIGGVKKFCPAGSRVVTDDVGCDVCKCCITTTGEYVVDCQSLNLEEIPPVPATTTVFDLQCNPIRHLYNQSFPHLANLTELKLGDQHFACYLGGYALKSAEIGVFQGLPRLRKIALRVSLDETNEFLKSARHLQDLSIICEKTQTTQEQKILFSGLRLENLQTFNCDYVLHEELFEVPPKRYSVEDSHGRVRNSIFLPGSSVFVESSYIESLNDCLNLSSVLAYQLTIECTTRKLDLGSDLLNWTDETNTKVNIVIIIHDYVKLNLGKHRLNSLDIFIYQFDEEEIKNFTTDLANSLQTSSVGVLNLMCADKLVSAPGLTGDEFLRQLIGPEMSQLKLINYNIGQVTSFDFNLTSFACYTCAFSCDFCIHAPSLRNFTIYESPSFVRLNLMEFLNSHPDIQHLALNADVKLGTLDLPEHRSIRQLDIWPTVKYLTPIDDYSKLNVSGLTNLQFLSIRNVVFDKRQEFMPSGNFVMKNLRKLSYFYFGYNEIKIRGPLDDMFSGLESLRTLHLVSNPFWRNLSQLRGLLRPVSKTLITLDLSKNDIDILPVDLFSDLINLASLDLNGNTLTSLDGNFFKNNPVLTTVRVRDNRIETIDADSVHVFSQMNYLRELVLSQNRLHCSCGNRNLREWISIGLKEGLLESDGDSPSAMTKEVCYSPEYLGSERMKFINFTLPWIACDFHREFVIVSCVLLVLLLITGACCCVYYYRHDIIFWWIVKRRHRVNRCHALHPQREFHAFLSYTSSEQNLAHYMFFELEDGLDVRFKIAYDCRDFMPGITIADNIIHFIDRSEKVIFLISRRFLEREWCEFEMNFAQMRCFDEKKNLIILIFVEKFKTSELPKRLRTLMRHVNYLEYPDEADVRGRHNFWKRLKVALARDSELELSPRQGNVSERYYDLPDERTPLVDEVRNSNSVI